ncbi:MAG: cell division protein FtsZ, partial [Solirubrobacteraceae bacterium]
MAAKRASMREGPLAALFRKTEQDTRAPDRAAAADEAQPDSLAGAAAAYQERVREEHEAQAAAVQPPPPAVRHPRESGVPHPALGASEGSSAVPTPQERLRAAFSSELPENILE